MGRNKVKPEQASKVLMRMPTLRSFGEGRTCGEAIDTCTHAIRRGSGHGTSEGWFVVTGGDPSRTRVAASASHRRWSRRESDGAIGALMPGNAGGAKGPDFWCAFEDGEVVVIGDEPANTINDRRRRRLLCRGAKESYSPCRSRVRLVCLRVPCGEASRKAGCRKSARPV
jgi:hypothetical protein